MPSANANSIQGLDGTVVTGSCRKSGVTIFRRVPGFARYPVAIPDLTSAAEWSPWRNEGP